jgi:hypothetical protein
MFADADRDRPITAIGDLIFYQGVEKIKPGVPIGVEKGVGATERHVLMFALMC